VKSLKGDLLALLLFVVLFIAFGVLMIVGILASLTSPQITVYIYEKVEKPGKVRWMLDTFLSSTDENGIGMKDYLIFYVCLKRGQSKEFCSELIEKNIDKDEAGIKEIVERKLEKLSEKPVELWVDEQEFGKRGGGEAYEMVEKILIVPMIKKYLKVKLEVWE
jgi:hypothetical protein